MARNPACWAVEASGARQTRAPVCPRSVLVEPGFAATVAGVVGSILRRRVRGAACQRVLVAVRPPRALSALERILWDKREQEPRRVRDLRDCVALLRLGRDPRPRRREFVREVWVSLRACPRARIAMRIWHHARRLPARSVVHVQSHVFAHTPKIVHQRRRDRAQNQHERGTRDAHA